MPNFFLSDTDFAKLLAYFKVQTIEELRQKLDAPQIKPGFVSKYTKEELQRIKLKYEIKRLKLICQKMEAEQGVLEKRLGERFTQKQWDLIYDTAILVTTAGRSQCWKCLTEFDSRKEAISHILNNEQGALQKLIPEVEKNARWHGHW